MPLNYLLAAIDCVIGFSCMAIGFLAARRRVRLTARSFVLAVASFGIVAAVGSFLFESGTFVPEINSPLMLLALIYLIGALKGVLLGSLVTLLVLKVLRPPMCLA